MPAECLMNFDAQKRKRLNLKKKGRADETLSRQEGGGARAVSATSLWKGQYLPESAEKPEMY